MVRKEKAEEVKTSKKTAKTSDLVDKVKTKVGSGVESVKEKLEDGVDMFSDEIDTAKKSSKKAIKWLTNNRHIIVGIILLGIGMRQLRQFIVGVLFLVAGVFFVSGFVNKK